MNDRFFHYLHNSQALALIGFSKSNSAIHSRGENVVVNLSSGEIKLGHSSEKYACSKVLQSSFMIFGAWIHKCISEHMFNGKVIWLQWPTQYLFFSYDNSSMSCNVCLFATKGPQT